MARTLIAATDYVVASGHPTLADVKNRYIAELWASFIAEHSATTGEHQSPYNALGMFEIDSYVGTGASLVITLTGNCASRPLKGVFIWSASYGGLYMKLDTMTNTKASTNLIAPFEQGITAMGDGTFTLGTSLNVNESGITYYFLAIAAGQTPDTGSAASPPSWIQHNIAMLGGIASTMANSVEDALDTQFQIEHSEAGFHTAAAFSGVSLVETGTFTPVGGSQEIDLVLTTQNIKYLLLLAENVNSPYFKTEDMTIMRQFTNAALPSTGYLTLGTGSFTIDGDQKLAAETILDIQDGAHAATTFTDSSAYAHTITKNGTPIWTNTTFAEGTTSIEFQYGDYLAIVDNDMALTGDFEMEFHIKGASTNKINSFFYARIASSAEGFSRVTWMKIGHSSGYSAGAGFANIEYYSKVGILPTVYGNITGTTDIKDNLWHQINVIYSAGVLELQVDSISEGTPAEIVFTFPSGGVTPPTFYIGGHESLAGALFYIDRPLIKRTDLVFAREPYHYLALGTI